MRNLKRATGNDFTSTASESQLQPELYAARVESGNEAQRLRDPPIAPSLQPHRPGVVVGRVEIGPDHVVDGGEIRPVEQVGRFNQEFDSRRAVAPESEGL